MKELDVTKIEGRMKHQTIFEWFDKLKLSDSFVIRNDHDPKPLYYTFQAERPGSFNWEYLEEGPEIWRVRLSRTEAAATPSIGDMVADDPRKAEVFRAYGIDFCCGGKIGLEEACKQYKVDIMEIKLAFQQLGNATETSGQRFRDWELDFLSDYIVHNHHTYVNQSFPLLLDFSKGVVHAHGDHHPEVVEVAAIIEELHKALIPHLKMEETDLFPLIKEWVVLKKSNENLQAVYAKLQTMITTLDEDHIGAGNLLKRLSAITNVYTAPADACVTYTTLYSKLAEFEKDLHQHIHLENNILIAGLHT